jgi:hypothetical protein
MGGWEGLGGVMDWMCVNVEGRYEVCEGREGWDGMGLRE